MPDKYANRAYISVTESAANTLTFTQLTTGISVFSKQALVIHRIQWYPTSYVALVANDDTITAALTSSNKMATLDLDDPAVIALRRWRTLLFGTPANEITYALPEIEDLSNLPGGGIIVPANPIFLAVVGASLAGANQVDVRVEFTVVDLKADEYIELVEATRMIE